MVMVGGYWFWFFIRVDVAAEGNSPFRVVKADLFILSMLASATLGLIWAAAGGGVGVLFGRRALLEGMPPWQTGGDMVERVTLERATWAAPPARFEADTPPIAEVIGLAAAIDYVESVGHEAIGRWEGELLERATELVSAIAGVRVIGTAKEKAGVLSFVVEGIHPHDVGTVLDDTGVAVRAGHHCAQPVMQRFGVPATVRASFAFYNTLDEVAALVRGVERARKVFG